jgi:hypothetical protein
MVGAALELHVVSLAIRFSPGISPAIEIGLAAGLVLLAALVASLRTSGLALALAFWSLAVVFHEAVPALLVAFMLPREYVFTEHGLLVLSHPVQPYSVILLIVAVVAWFRLRRASRPRFRRGAT